MKTYIKNKAFTLIELIVVIAVIAILAAAVTANVIGHIKKAKIAGGQTEITQIWAAMDVFYSKYGNYPLADQADIVLWGQDPFSIIDGQTYYLSEFIKVDWADASYFCNGCKYYVEVDDLEEPYDIIDTIGIGISDREDFATGKYIIKYFYPDSADGDFENNL